MTLTEHPVSHKVLLVDDDDAVRDMMTATLEHKGFDVVAATNVTEALKLITTNSFDVLITDLHMPNPGDGFAVITAMRHLSNLKALSAAARRLPRRAECDGLHPSPEADEIIVKPLEAKTLADLVRDKLLTLQ